MNSISEMVDKILGTQFNENTLFGEKSTGDINSIQKGMLGGTLLGSEAAAFGNKDNIAPAKNSMFAGMENQHPISNLYNADGGGAYKATQSTVGNSALPGAQMEAKEAVKYLLGDLYEETEKVVNENSIHNFIKELTRNNLTKEATFIMEALKDVKSENVPVMLVLKENLKKKVISPELYTLFEDFITDYSVFAVLNENQ